MSQGSHMPTSPPTQEGSGSGLRLWTLLAIMAGLTLVYVTLRPRLAGEVPGMGVNHPAVGRPLAPVALVSLSGAPQNIAREELLGQVVVLHFWGTWCGPCIRELPHIVHLQESLRDQRDFRLLAVSCWGEGNEPLAPLRAETEAFLRQHQLQLPVFADPQMTTRETAHALGAFDGYPTTIVLDRQGIVRAVWIGYYPGAERRLERLVRDLLADRHAPLS